MVSGWWCGGSAGAMRRGAEEGRAAAMAESKGCVKALRRVTCGGADSTSSPGRAPSNIRDCVATKKNLTQSAQRTQSARRKIDRHKECRNGASAAAGTPYEEGELLFGSRGFCSGVGVLLAESFHPAAGVPQLLLSPQQRSAVPPT